MEVDRIEKAEQAIAESDEANELAQALLANSGAGL